MALDHYRIDGPTVISFSGGRTSGYLLRKVLDAHGGTLPDDAAVLFQNTGKEREETLVFIEEVSQRWGVPITWLEWQKDDPKYRVVDFETASRGGEPFEELIAWKKYLPNPIARICTQYLKVDCAARYVRGEIGWPEWDTMIGIRHDEPRRWRIEGVNEKNKAETRTLPLRHAGIGEAGVLKFWAAQPFDLSLRRWEGNCDLCFLKGKAKRLRILEDHPGMGGWWARMEGDRSATFRSGDPYRALIALAENQLRLPLVLDDPTDLGECLCHD